jgi:hypothetical protein
MFILSSKLTWTVRNNWCKVIFSDETKVVIGAEKKIYNWRRCNERYIVLTNDKERYPPERSMRCFQSF